MDGNVVLDIVHHLDDNAIAVPCDYLGAGELAVHRRDGAGGAQPCHILHRHLPHMIKKQQMIDPSIIPTFIQNFVHIDG